TYTKMFGRPWGLGLHLDSSRWFMRDQGLSELEVLGVSFDNGTSRCMPQPGANPPLGSAAYFITDEGKNPPIMAGVTNPFFGDNGLNGPASGGEWDKMSHVRMDGTVVSDRTKPLHGHLPPSN